MGSRIISSTISKNSIGFQVQLLTVPQKPDSHVVKELSIVTLTKIFCMTHQYQTLVREITTPTLPAFIQACINVVSPKSSSNAKECSQSLIETVFRSFSALLPRHFSTFRPFASQTRLLARPYVAPTISDVLFVPSSLQESARRLIVDLHRTVAKNGGSEEWERAVRELINNIHVTADQVFRAVVEDWESTSGYIGRPVDVNQELAGGGRDADDLPQWAGIAAGMKRLVGLIESLEEYFKGETETAVAIPVSSILDLLTRLLTIPLPSQDGSPEHDSVRLHPAIDRDERDCLCSGLPQIYVAALQLVGTIADRLEGGFVSLTQGSIDLLLWAFKSGRHVAEFRLVAYKITMKILSHMSGQSLDKSRIMKLVPIVRCCCEDVSTVGPSFTGPQGDPNTSKAGHTNADAFLPGLMNISIGPEAAKTDLYIAASQLLPMLLSHIPQGHLDISMRSLLERTAILTHNKDAMLASILNPFVGKNGKAIASILPHLTRAYPHDDIVEILLRPRLPLVPAKGTFGSSQDIPVTEAYEYDDATMIDYAAKEEGLTLPPPTGRADLNPVQPIIESESISAHHGFGIPVTENEGIHSQGLGISETVGRVVIPLSTENFTSTTFTTALVAAPPVPSTTGAQDAVMGEEDDSSSDESVHLTMELDDFSDSE